VKRMSAEVKVRSAWDHVQHGHSGNLATTPAWRLANMYGGLPAKGNEKSE
jgi:hypothetical protein